MKRREKRRHWRKWNTSSVCKDIQNKSDQGEVVTGFAPYKKKSLEIMKAGRILFLINGQAYEF